MTPVSVPAQMAEAMAQLLEAVDPIREAIVGYHRMLTADGMGSAAADAMAVELHRHLLEAAFRLPAAST